MSEEEEEHALQAAVVNSPAQSGSAGLQVLNVLPKKSRKRTASPIRKMRVACVLCQVNKQKCDAQRPCSRCVAKGKAHMCVDRNSDSVIVPAITTAATTVSSFNFSASVEVVTSQQDVISLLPPKRPYKKRKKKEETNRKAKSKSSSNEEVEQVAAQIQSDQLARIGEETQEERNPVYVQLPSLNLSADFSFESADAILRSTLVPSSNQSDVSGESNGVLSQNMGQLFSDVVFNFVKSYHTSKSPFAVHDLITHESTNMKMYFTSMHRMFGLEEAQRIRDVMKESVQLISELNGSNAASNLVLDWLDKMELFGVDISPSIQIEDFHFPEDHFRLIKDKFNILTIANSDLVINRCKHILDLDANLVSLKFMGNLNFMKVVGREMKDLPMCDSQRIPAFTKIMSQESARAYMNFFLLSFFKEASFMEERIDLKNADGSITPCFGLLLAEYDPVSSFRTSLTMVLRPLSVTFNPMLYKPLKI
jgi:hypothetical protein